MATLSNFGVLEVIPFDASAVSTVTGAAVDLQGYVTNRQLKSIVSAVVTGTDTDETLDVTMEESDTTVASDFAAITGAAHAQITEVATAVSEMHFRTDKRYIRAVATIAGTTPDFGIAVAVVAEKRQTP
jgi:hypothetical protein